MQGCARPEQCRQDCAFMQTVLDKLLGMCAADVALLLPALEALSMLCLDDELQAWKSAFILLLA